MDFDHAWPANLGARAIVVGREDSEPASRKLDCRRVDLENEKRIFDGLSNRR